MALSFFRRRQKMVVIIMALLMVSFLIGPKLGQMGNGCGSKKYVKGTALGKELTYDQVTAASYELDKLRQYVGLGTPDRNQPPESPLAGEMHAVMGLLQRGGSEGDQATAYALLIREAEAQGITVSNAELNAFFKGIGLRDEYYTNRVAEARSDGLHEDSFRGIAAKWLMVFKAYQNAVPATPPSLKELQHAYRDANEKIKLRILRIKAKDMMGEAQKNFSDEEIRKHFDDLKHVQAGQMEGIDSFGFGYRQPDRVSLDYLLVDEQVIARVTKATNKEARQYYSANKSKYVREMPIAAPEIKPTASTSPTSQPEVQRELRQLTPAEAMDEILDELARAKAVSKTAALTNVIASMVASASTDGTTKDTYAKITSKMVFPADSVLARKITKLDLNAVPLDKAIEKIAKAAQVDAICYPWGKTGPYDLSPKIKVTLQPKTEITLRDALQRVTSQVFGPQTPTGDATVNPSAAPILKWGMCKGFDNVLFPIGGDIEMLPFRAGSTGLLTYDELSDHKILGTCSTALRGGRPLAQIAFMTKALLPAGQSSAIQVGKDGPRMVLTGARSGRLLWRPLKAVAAHTPTELTPQLRWEVTRDLRLKVAYEAAYAKAVKAAETAKTKGLEAAAQELKLKTFDTDMFTRKLRNSMARDLIYLRQQYGLLSPGQAFVQLHMAMPAVYTWTQQLGDFEIPSPKHAEEFMSKAFSLAPQDVEKPIDPAARGPVALFPLPATPEVLVMERLAYEPAMVDQFEKTGRSSMAGELMALRRWAVMMRWFNFGQIKARTSFVANKID